MKKILKQVTITTAILTLGTSVLPSSTVLAHDLNNTIIQVTSDDHIVVTDTELIINGKSYTEQELLTLLEMAIPQPQIQIRSAIAIGGATSYAGSYLIPGVGQVLLAATGVVIIGGVTIYATHWAANVIKNFFNNEDNMTANDIISNRRKAGVRREFPGEYLNKTLKQIKKEADAGNARAKKAKKLLQDGRFKK
jgi:hypothetical protein